MDDLDAILDELDILPPGMHCCEVCADDHEESEPHNRNSLHYQVRFFQENGRFPTWDDAMAHCSEEVKAKTIRRLENAGLRKRMDP